MLYLFIGPQNFHPEYQIFRFINAKPRHDVSDEKAKPHRRIPVSGFIEVASSVFKNDELLLAFGQSAGLRSKPEAVFE